MTEPDLVIRLMDVCSVCSAKNVTTFQHFDKGCRYCITCISGGFALIAYTIIREARDRDHGWNDCQQCNDKGPIRYINIEGPFVRTITVQVCEDCLVANLEETTEMLADVAE